MLFSKSHRDLRCTVGWRETPAWALSVTRSGVWHQRARCCYITGWRPLGSKGEGRGRWWLRAGSYFSIKPFIVSFNCFINIAMTRVVSSGNLVAWKKSLYLLQSGPLRSRSRFRISSSNHASTLDQKSSPFEIRPTFRWDFFLRFFGWVVPEVSSSSSISSSSS